MKAIEKQVKIGVLALQGAFREHVEMLEKCGAQAVLIRRASEISGLDGLIIPGGESTTIAKLAELDNNCIFDAIHDAVVSGLPVWGTCMGAIVLARHIEGSKQGRLSLMDICVNRNAFGPQKTSFEVVQTIAALGKESPFRMIFIRAPLITGAGSGVEVLSVMEAQSHPPFAEGVIPGLSAVMARQKNMLVTAFHPELGDDCRVHRLFLEMVEQTKFHSAVISSSSPNSHSCAPA